MHRLALEVQAFHEYVRPNQAESIARKHVVEQVRQHVRSILPNYILEVFGSERSGVAFANSDIDLRLVPNDVMSDVAQAKLPPNPKERDRRMKDLRKLHNRLINLYKKDYLLPTLRWARYPLISLQDKASGLDIQVVLSNDTSTSREFMKRYIDEYAYLPQLYSVLKATLDVRGLTDVFRGGVGSYSLFMMIVASLKHKQHPCNDAGDALAHFLRFWSTIKAEDHGISIEPPELFAKSEQLVMHNKAVGHIQVYNPPTTLSSHTNTSAGRQSPTPSLVDAHTPRPSRRNQRPRTQNHRLETHIEDLKKPRRATAFRHEGEHQAQFAGMARRPYLHPAPRAAQKIGRVRTPRRNRRKGTSCRQRRSQKLLET